MMNTAKEIEKAIESLPQSELKEFRAWFERYDAEIWDEKIDQHAASGKLSDLGRAAIESHKAKLTKEL